MRAFTSDTFVLPLPERHRFPMAKYRRLRERVEAELDAVHLEPALPVDPAQLALVHDASFLARVFDGALTDKEVRVLGFPQIPELVWRERHSSGGTLCAARAALEDGAAVNLAGGTHHAGPARAQGYCLFNDAAVTLRTLQAEGRIRRALVVDLDVHQGNGTAECLAPYPSLFTFSVHGAKNFPFQKATSDLDVPLDDGLSDEAYLEAVQQGLGAAFEAARPDLVVFNAGVDVFEGDTLGRLAVSAAGVAERDALVFAACTRHGVPVAVTMGGGYAKDVETIVDLHLNTIRAAARTRGIQSPSGVSPQRIRC
jgi:acetoin utilization deacetylase AcuC-like enzyme